MGEADAGNRSGLSGPALSPWFRRRLADFANHVLNTLVFSQAFEGRVADHFVRSPAPKLDLGDQLRLCPEDASALLRRQLILERRGLGRKATETFRQVSRQF